MEYHIEDISNNICLDNFDCKVSSINNFLKKESYYKHILKESRTQLVLDRQNNVIAFYTIMFEEIFIEDDYDIIKIPVLEIEYLAVDRKYHNNNIGTDLLMKIIAELEKQSEIIGGCGILIKALVDKEDWYSKRGFININIYNYNDIYTVPMYWNLRNEDLIESYFDEEV